MVTKNFKEKISHIKAFVFDCDGVFTNGTVTMCEDFELRRTYNVHDSYAVVRAIKAGYPVGIISGGMGKSMNLMFEKKLGIKDVYLSSTDKVSDLMDFCSKNGVEPADILYIGDDIPDMRVMSMVGISVAPANAALEVKAIATHVSNISGGSGCVRDAIEQVMKARGHWCVPEL